MSRIEELNDANIRVVYNDAGDIEALIDDKGRALNIPLVSKDVTGKVRKLKSGGRDVLADIASAETNISAAEFVEDVPAVTVASSSGYGPNFVLYDDAKFRYWGSRVYETSPVGIIGDGDTATLREKTPMYWAIGVVAKSAKFRCQFPTASRRGYRIWIGGKPVKKLPRGGAVSIGTTSGSNTITASVAALDRIISGAEITATGVPAGTTVISVALDGTSAKLSANATATATVSATFAGLDGLGYVSAAATTDITLTWGAVGPRDIVMHADGGIHSVTIPDGTFFRSSARTGRRAVVLSDSWGQAGIGGVMQAVERMGYSDIHLCASGGTGYLAVNSESGAGNYLTRFETEVLPVAPDDIFIFGSLNDSEAGYTGAQVAAQARLLYTRIAAALPNAEVYVSGVQFANENFTFNRDETNAALAALVGDYKQIKAFITPKGWVNGYGNIGAPDGGLCDYYTIEDENHLVIPYGYGYWSSRFLNALRGII